MVIQDPLLAFNLGLDLYLQEYLAFTQINELDYAPCLPQGDKALAYGEDHIDLGEGVYCAFNLHILNIDDLDALPLSYYQSFSVAYRAEGRVSQLELG